MSDLKEEGRILIAFYRCAFCGKNTNEVRYLIQSQYRPEVSICNICVNTCEEMLLTEFRKDKNNE